MRVASSYLNGFVAVHLTTLEEDLSRGKLRLKRAMAELSMAVPTPCIDLTEGASGDGVSVTTLD